MTVWVLVFWLSGQPFTIDNFNSRKECEDVAYNINHFNLNGAVATDHWCISHHRI